MTQQDTKNGQRPTRGMARRTNRKPESLGSKDSEYVDTIVSPDNLDDRWKRWIESEFSKDYPLANFPRGHAEREELLLENRMDMMRHSYPPEQSAVQGHARKSLIGDRKRSLGAEDLFRLRSFTRRIVARIRRGERGWQQDKFDGVLSVSKSESGSGRSLREKLFG